MTNDEIRELAKRPEAMRTYIARLMFEALDDIGIGMYVCLSPNLSSVTLDGSVDLLKVADYILDKIIMKPENDRS
jgi:hypothetical protein